MTTAGGDVKVVSFDDVVCKYATDNALLCEIDGKDHWIPLSQVDEETSEVQDDDCCSEGILVITERIAIQKGLL